MKDLKEKVIKFSDTFQNDKVLQLLYEEAKTTEYTEDLTEQIELRQKYLSNKLEECNRDIKKT